MILVSHDRAFLRELATRVWAFDGTHITDFDGPFVEWEADKAIRVAKASRAVTDAADARRAQDKATAKKNPKKPAQSVQTDTQAARKANKRAADDAEKSVARHEARVAEIEGQLAEADLYDGTAEGARKAAQLDKELAKARRDLDAAMAAWAEASEQN